jgi:hypothetical protein
MRDALIFISAMWAFGSHAADFSGHWRDDQPCGAEGHGAHYSLTLKRINRDHYTGSWESSTNTKGSTGKAYGRTVSGILRLEGCTADSSWSESSEEMCPQLRPLGSYMLRRGKLVSVPSASQTLPEGATVVEQLSSRKHSQPVVALPRYTPALSLSRSSLQVQCP